MSIRAGWGATPLLHAPSQGSGTPLWAGWVRICRALEAHELWWGTGAGTVLMVVAGELALLVAAVGIYRFVRREDLPQTAERATWLWALCPAMVVTIPASSWNFAIAGASVGLAAIRSRHFWGATAAVALAIGFRIETVVLWPGFVWLALDAYRPGKDSGAGLWGAAFGPLAAFTASVGSATLFAGRLGISIRSIHPAASWRTDWGWRAIGGDAPLMAVSVVAVLGLFLLVRSVRRDGGRSLLAAAPLLVWPALHDPVSEACGAFLLAMPAFAVLARNLEDISLERPAMVASTVGLAVWLL